ncbi:MAG: glycosyltransferase [Hyphomicrobiales bacterium]|nr:MAG: glycosyltransferase [Hyphomicrobiales bacterium]
MDIVTILSLICLAASALVLVPALVLAVEMVFARPAHAADRPMPAEADGGAVVVLVPAHDEAAGIEATLAKIKAGLPPRARILVVADNCTDDTAQRARAAGADVVERFDPAQRGKGYALAFGVKALAANPPDVVLIIDADCEPRGAAIAQVAGEARARNCPVQGLYLLDPPDGALSQYMKVAMIAWRLKNFARPLGLMNMGFPCHLLGTGMALPWSVVEKVNLATGHLTEDVALGLDCAALGFAPRFCPSALFVSRFPSNTDAQSTQRQRWEAGHVSIITERVPRLLGIGVRQRNIGLIALALDIAVPPLALLALLICASLGIPAIVALLGGWTGPFWMSAAALALLVGSVLWARELVIKDTMSILDLMLTPAYVVAKLVLYFRMMVGRNVEWVRTGRD